MSAAKRYELTFIFEAEDDTDALRQEDAAYEELESVVDQKLVCLDDGRKL